MGAAAASCERGSCRREQRGVAWSRLRRHAGEACSGWSRGNGSDGRGSVVDVRLVRAGGADGALLLEVVIVTVHVLVGRLGSLHVLVLGVSSAGGVDLRRGLVSAGEA